MEHDLIVAKLEEDLLYFACCHDILGLVIEAVFSVLMQLSQNPDILLFKRFQAQWKYINKSQFKAGADNKAVFQLIGIRNLVSWTGQR